MFEEQDETSNLLNLLSYYVDRYYHVITNLTVLCQVGTHVKRATNDEETLTMFVIRRVTTV